MEATPGKVLVFSPHPDDADLGCSGTLSKWIGQGSDVIYVICTNGDKGTNDPDMTSERLANLREQEQTAAAQSIGAKELIFLRRPDGGLEDTPEFREEIVRLIKRHRPDVVLTVDPLRRPFQHRDHRITGQVVLDAVFPAARDHLYYPEHKAQGLLPHKVREVYLWGSDSPDLFIDISDDFPNKVSAVKCHASQVGRNPHSNIEERLRQGAERQGEPHGLALAESFRRLEFPG